MKMYLIYYWDDINDNPTEQEMIMKADDMEQAIKTFKKQVKSYKSITTITELCYA
jgi:hypothetical protein